MSVPNFWRFGIKEEANVRCMIRHLDEAIACFFGGVQLALGSAVRSETSLERLCKSIEPAARHWTSLVNRRIKPCAHGRCFGVNAPRIVEQIRRSRPDRRPEGFHDPCPLGKVTRLPIVSICARWPSSPEAFIPTSLAQASRSRPAPPTALISRPSISNTESEASEIQHAATWRWAASGRSNTIGSVMVCLDGPGRHDFDRAASRA